MNYDEFLKSKVIVAPESGFDVEASEVNPKLRPTRLDGPVRGGGGRSLRASASERRFRSWSFADLP